MRFCTPICGRFKRVCSETPQRELDVVALGWAEICAVCGTYAGMMLAVVDARKERKETRDA